MAVAALLLSTIALVMWLATAGAVAYALWRYCFVPWSVVRRDLAALDATLAASLRDTAAQLAALDEFTRSARIQGLSDEEAASRERRWRAKRAAQMVVP